MSMSVNNPLKPVLEQNPCMKNSTEHKKMKLMKSSSNEDFISELPDSLLHHILSFLDMTYVMRTSILSKRWRNLWTSLPFLNFNEDVYNPFRMDTDDVTRNYKDIFHFVDRVLFLRNATNIHTFSLCLEDYGRMNSRRLTTWLDVAVRCNLEVLDLAIKTLFIPLELSHCLLTCKSLTTLMLSLGDHECPMIFELPDSVSLPALKTLYLISVPFADGERIENFLSRCPILETLFICRCRVGQMKTLTISAPQLKNLVIDILQMDTSYPQEYYKIRVCAPNLTSFKCRDFKFSDYSMVNISSLVKADISIFFPISFDQIVAKEEEIQNVLKCLRGLSNIRSLTLSCMLVEVLNTVRGGFGNLLTPFCSLSVLKLTTQLSSDYNYAITSLLDKCPNIETLSFRIVRRVKVYSRNEEERCEFSLQCRLHCLKFVEFHGFEGYENEVELLKFFLENAVVLEKMIVFTSGREYEYGSSDERLKRFSERLLTFPRGSSSVEVLII